MLATRCLTSNIDKCNRFFFKKPYPEDEMESELNSKYFRKLLAFLDTDGPLQPVLSGRLR